MTNKAFLCGIGSGYPDPYKLDAPPYDLIAVKNFLTSRGFSSTVLQNSQVTKTNTLSKLTTIVRGTYGPGKIVVFFDGHGTGAPDQNGDEPDGYDEVFVTYDFFQPPLYTRYIRDDDLRAIFAQLHPGVTLEFWGEYCFSGTGTRAASSSSEWKPHSIPILGRTPKGPKRSRPTKEYRTRSATIVPDLNHIAITACRDIETSWEGLINGIPRSVFNYYLLEAIQNEVGTREQIINYVQERVAALGLAQTPQLECTEAEASQWPFC